MSQSISDEDLQIIVEKTQTVVDAAKQDEKFKEALNNALTPKEMSLVIAEKGFDLSEEELVIVGKICRFCKPGDPRCKVRGLHEIFPNLLIDDTVC